jgi:RHS repeat-associated protein
LSDLLHTDYLESTTLTTDVNGYQVGSTQRYELYGEPRTPVLTSTDRLYTGQVYDRDVQLMYYGARYYDAVLGRFVQADTVVPEPGNPQALNRYSYVANSPLRFTDPSGHSFCEDAGCRHFWKILSANPKARSVLG